MITINTWVLAGVLLVMGMAAGAIGYVRGRDIKQERMNALQLVYKMLETGQFKSDGNGNIQIVAMPEELREAIKEEKK